MIHCLRLSSASSSQPLWTADTITRANFEFLHHRFISGKKEQVMMRMEKRRTKVDLAFPTVVITSAGLDKRRRRKWSYYRFLAVLFLLLLSLVHFIDRTMLRMPRGETRLNLSHVTKISDLSVEGIDSWCLQEVREHGLSFCKSISL